MTLYHYFLVKKESGKETTIDGIWGVEKPIATMDDYREFKRQISGEETIEEAKKWICQTLHRLDCPISDTVSAGAPCYVQGLEK